MIPGTGWAMCAVCLAAGPLAPTTRPSSRSHRAGRAPYPSAHPTTYRFEGYKCRDCDFLYLYEADIVLHRRSMHREARLLAMLSKERAGSCAAAAAPTSTARRGKAT